MTIMNHLFANINHLLTIKRKTHQWNLVFIINHDEMSQPFYCWSSWSHCSPREDHSHRCRAAPLAPADVMTADSWSFPEDSFGLTGLAKLGPTWGQLSYPSGLAGWPQGVARSMLKSPSWSWFFFWWTYRLMDANWWLPVINNFFPLANSQGS